MSNVNEVGSSNFASFGYPRLASVAATSFNTAGNAVITLPILKGGLTAGNTVISSGSIILRRVTVMNPTGSLASANVSITTSGDGNISNAVVANVTLTSITGTGTFQDLAISGGNVVVSGYNTQALYVNVNTASGNNNTADIRIFGDVVNF